MTTDASTPASEIQAIRDMLDALMVRIAAAVFDKPTGTEHRIVVAEVELDHKLADARDALDALAAAVHANLERTKIPTRICRCKGDDYTDVSDCPIHTIAHPYTNGCCVGEEDAHRHMTGAEYRIAYPIIFDEKFTVGEDTYRVDARRYSSGDGVSFTRLFPNKDGEIEDDDDYGGLCFDFSREVVPELIRVLQELQASA